MKMQVTILLLLVLPVYGLAAGDAIISTVGKGVGVTTDIALEKKC